MYMLINARAVRARKLGIASEGVSSGLSQGGRAQDNGDGGTKKVKV